jgi:SWI/SNF-related matrix-associated actin-dependent regulator of chromatin subfamily B protein 1
MNAAQQQAMANLPPGTDPARTRVTEVPLASSGSLIPPLSPKSIEELKAVIKRDDTYAVIKRDMDTRMRDELNHIGGPASWWEKDSTGSGMPHTGSAGKFGIMWPAEKWKAKERWRKRLGRKDLFRLYVFLL